MNSSLSLCPRKSARLFLVLAIAIGILASFFFFESTGAQSITDELGSQLNAAAGSEGAGFAAAADPRTIAARYIKLFLTFLGLITVVYAVYAGYLIMTSAGNDSQIEKGKQTLRNAIIGLAIITSAYSITWFAYKLAAGDDKYSGDYIEIREDNRPNLDPLNQGNVPDAFSPLPRNADGSRGIYENR